MLAGLTGPDVNVSGTITTSSHLPLNRQISFMAQQDLLLPWLTTFANVTISLKLRRHTKKETARKLALAATLLNQAGLQAAHELYPHQLSGGMRQRAALVRTLMEEQPIVLMDEPFSALDAITRYQLQDVATSMLQDKTVVFITHDPGEALRMADEIYLLHGNPASLQLMTLPEDTHKDQLYQAMINHLIRAESVT
jgi:putative hydroxymethylpyrimidine transport system ATP-binding protein